jgi:AraC-like DNA-binding protein
MKLGGIIERREQTVEAALLQAHTGETRFVVTRWKYRSYRWWVLDYINQGQQQQRIGRGKTFTRVSGVAALYAPGRDYGERQIAGGSVDESYIMFEARDAEEAWLRQLAGVKGWCHFYDPDHLLGASLRRAAEIVFYRRPGFHLLAHGTLMEQLGLLLTASPVAPNLREIRAESGADRRHELIGAVERFIGDHISEPVREADLARHVKMSKFAFAHAYPRLAGESPCCTVRRLKLEAAKRFLLHDGLSVKECAERLGFSSEFHFSRLFKRLEGLPPTRYRQALTEKTGLAAPPRRAVPSRTHSLASGPDRHSGHPSPGAGRRAFKV